MWTPNNIALLTISQLSSQQEGPLPSSSFPAENIHSKHGPISVGGSDLYYRCFYFNSTLISLSVSHTVIDQGQDKLTIAMKAGRELAKELMKQTSARSGFRDTRTTPASETSFPHLHF